MKNLQKNMTIELAKKLVTSFFLSKDIENPDEFYNNMIKLSNSLAQYYNYTPPTENSK